MPATPRMRRISDMRVAELRAELEKRSLETKGLKGALIQRLQQAINDEETENENNSPQKNKGVISESQSPTDSKEKNASDTENTEPTPTEMISTESDIKTSQNMETENDEVLNAVEQEISLPPVEVTEISNEVGDFQVVNENENPEGDLPQNDEEECIESAPMEDIKEEEAKEDDDDDVPNDDDGPNDDYGVPNEDGVPNDNDGVPYDNDDDPKDDDDGPIDDDGVPNEDDDDAPKDDGVPIDDDDAPKDDGVSNDDDDAPNEEEDFQHEDLSENAEEQNDIEDDEALRNDVGDSDLLKEEDQSGGGGVDEDVESNDQIEKSSEQEEVHVNEEEQDEDSVLDSSVPESDVAQEGNLSEDERFYSFAEDAPKQEDDERNEMLEENEQEEVIEEESEITEEYVAYVTVDENEQQEENFAPEEDGDQTPDLEENEAHYCNEEEPRIDSEPVGDQSEENHHVEEDSGAMEVGEEQQEDGDEEDIVAIEEDVLDMLDYDIEMPDNQHGKFDSREKGEESNNAKERNLAVKKSQQKPISSDGIRKLPSESAAVSTEKSTRKESLSETKNLWISGLSSSTRASELKVAFSRYGKVVGAKVVTNAKSPGSKCFGFVAMSTADAANKCILHLNRTEMHGHYITVERTRTDPSASKKSTTTATKHLSKDPNKQSEAVKQDNTTAKGSSDNKERISPKRRNTSKERTNKPSPKGREDSRNEVNKRIDARRRTQTNFRSYRRKSDVRASPRTGQQVGDKRGNEVTTMGRKSSVGEPIRKRPRNPDGRREVVIDNKAGELSLRVNVSSNRSRATAGSSVLTRLKRSPPPLRERISRVAGDNDRSTRTGNFIPNSNFRRRGSGLQRHNMGINRQNTNAARQSDNPFRPGSFSRQSGSMAETQLRSRKQTEHRHFRGRGNVASNSHLGFNRREMLQSTRVLPPSLDRSRLLSRKEREQRELLQLEREKLERERRQLERDRQERERLERERLKLEQERKLELEKIGKAKDEMRRLQEINRYEQVQRQRAIKRTYDAVPTTSRRTQSSNDRREDRDDRRGYQYSTRERGSDPPQVRSEQESYRSGRMGERSTQPSLIARGSSKSTLNQNYHDTDRRKDVLPSRDTDARYGSEKKFERTERETDYDRRSSQTNISSFPRDGRELRESRAMDDRKIISRERNSRSSRSPIYRRATNNLNTARKDATFTNSSTSASIRRRPTDRDMREDAGSRNVSDYESGRKSERSGRKMEQREARHHSNPGTSSRSGLKYRGESDNRSGDMTYSSKRSPVGAAVSGKPIPTTARTQPDPWSSWQQQQLQPRGGNSAMWTGGSSVQAPPLGVPPPLVGFNGIPTNEHSHIQGLPAGISLLPHGAFFAPNRPAADNRYDGYKNIRRF